MTDENSQAETATDAAAAAEDLRLRSAIDRSVRYPVMFFFTSAAAWLFVATILGLLSGIKLVNPDLGPQWTFLTYGRLWPLHTNALIYGWGMQAGFGLMLWLMARLCRTEVRNSVTLLVAGHVWNIGITVGFLAMAIGQGSSMPWLEFPAFVWPFLALTYIVLTLTLVQMFRLRRGGSLFISQMYVLGAALWFPWIYITANVLIHNDGGSAVMKAGVNAWFMSNLVYFWFVPIALAAAYYLVPKISGRAISSYPLAKLGFWSLAVFAGWTGFSRYNGGPFPAWMTSVSGAATIFVLLPALLVWLNLRQTVKGSGKLADYSPALRFTNFGILMFLLFCALSALVGFYAPGRYLQFSHATIGIDTLGIYGMFSMVAFGAIYFIVPRITGCEWPSAKLINFHFWFSSYGILTVVGFMLFGGLAQGSAMNNWTTNFIASVELGNGYVIGRCIAWLLIAVANLAFFYQLALMFIGKGRKSEGATLLHGEPGIAATSAEAVNLSHSGAAGASEANA
jgi:cytochrome c oxidase cbb3-type subunit 1